MEEHAALEDQQTPNPHYEPPTSTHDVSSSVPHQQGPISTVSTDQEEPAAKRVKVEVFEGQDLNADLKQTGMSSNQQPQPASSSSNNNITNTTSYTIKVYFGEPEIPLRSEIKNMKKDDLVAYMKKRGFSTEECNLKKPELLTKLQKDLAFVVLEIDENESLDSLLCLSLVHWNWPAASLTHLTYLATLPVRSEASGKGVMTFEQALPKFFYQQSISSTVKKEQKLREVARKGLAAYVEYEPNQWRQWLLSELVEGKIAKHVLFPLRYVGGAIGETENFEVTNIPLWIENGQEKGEQFEMDLNSIGLRPGDTIRFHFLVQYQSSGGAMMPPISDVKNLSAHVLSKQENSQLPAVSFGDDEKSVFKARVLEANNRALPFRPGGGVTSATPVAAASSSGQQQQSHHQLLSQQQSYQTASNIGTFPIGATASTQPVSSASALMQNPFASPAAVNLHREMAGLSSEKAPRRGGQDEAPETSELTESEGEGFGDEGEEDPFA